MSEDCKVCLKSLERVKVKVSCVDCKKSFHGRCVNLTGDDINFLVEQGNLWRCSVCSQVRRKSMVLETTGNVTCDDIFKLIAELRDDFSRVEANLGTSLNACHEEIAETKKIVSEQKEELSKWMKTVEDLRNENAGLRKQVAELELRVDEAEQYSRRNTLEIHGVPMQKNENVITIVQEVGRALDFPISASMIDACHRLRAREGSERHPGIIVKMVRRLDAEELLQKRRVKRNLNTHDIGLTSSPAEVVYINESLSPTRRRLLYAARQTKKDKDYTYLWVRGGKIFLRKDQGSTVKVVRKLDDLNNM